MSLVYDARDSTQDVDALYEPKNEISDIARSIAQEYGLEKDWQNDGSKGFFSPKIITQTIIELPALMVKSLLA